MSSVSYVKIQGPCLKKAISNSLDLLDYRFSKSIGKVVIKPNMCYYWDHSTGQTTDPRFVEAVIQLLREEISPNIDISVVESDASAMKCKYVFKFLGYEKMAKNNSVGLVNLADDKLESVEASAGNQLFHFMIPETIQNADLRINIPKIKYLSRTKISCALKNVFGCNAEPNKFKYHPRLDEAIVALNTLMKFNLCILDGLVVSGSQPVKLSLVMASQDPVAFDAAAAEIAGVNPRSVRHIMLANKEGLGNLIFISKGDDPSYFKMRFPKRNLTDKILSSAYRFATWSGLLNTEML